ncbi:hypothetical protein FS837_004747 [Tulasnella sp. UAMH 9824]|nr:hypothetical protein FS837_004747 [Tulasnella sp. UAMH 9824]
MDKLLRSTNSRSSAIQNAPPEIIGTILENLVASSQTLPMGRKYRDLILFTHVSSRLRTIAITTPTLWTRIEITGIPSTFELAKTCLQRSGSQKLDITISIMSRLGTKLPGILALVSYAAVRTEKLSLNMALRKENQWTDIQNTFQAFVSPCLDNLELKLRDDGGSVPEELRTISLPTQVPQLRSLVLGQAFPPAQPTLLGNLRKLVLISDTQSSWPFSRLQDVLDRCQQLGILELIAKRDIGELGGPVGHTSDRKEPTRQSLPKLSRLTMKGQSSIFFEHLLRYLDAPELEEVELGYARGDFGWQVDWASGPSPFHSVQLLRISLPQYCGEMRLERFLPKAFPDFEELALSKQTWPLLQKFSAALGGEDDDESRSTRSWARLRGLSVADPEEQHCDSDCMEKLKAVEAFLRARSSNSLPGVEWVQVSVCELVMSEEEFDSTVDAIQKMLPGDDGLAFFFIGEACRSDSSRSSSSSSDD